VSPARGHAGAVALFLRDVLLDGALAVDELDAKARAVGLLGPHQRVGDSKGATVLRLQTLSGAERTAKPAVNLLNTNWRSWTFKSFQYGGLRRRGPLARGRPRPASRRLLQA
jgi:hypothetical protein